MVFFTKEKLWIVSYFILMIILSILVHEEVHVLQALCDDRVEAIGLVFIENASYPGMNFTSWGIGVKGNWTTKNLTVMREYLDEWHYREAQAYIVQGVYLILMFSLLNRKINKRKEKEAQRNILF